jgi:cbb3-type cytochrome c oxidase subunit III
MRGGLRSLASLSALVAFLACSSDRGARAPATSGQTSDTALAAPSDTATAVTPDTGRRDTAAPTAQSNPTVAQGTTPKQPAPAPKPAAPKPAAPKPPPAPAPVPADSVTAPAPAETTQATAAPSAEASAPLRDPYHQAPRDTVTAEVYDGWKQFNLNCARCHGEDVLGTTIAPHLIVSVRPGGPVDTKEAFVQTVCAGRPEKGMPSWCALGMEMDKINAIYAYVKGRSEGKIAPGRPARQQ